MFWYDLWMSLSQGIYPGDLLSALKNNPFISCGLTSSLTFFYSTDKIQKILIWPLNLKFHLSFVICFWSHQWQLFHLLFCNWRASSRIRLFQVPLALSLSFDFWIHKPCMFLTWPGVGHGNFGVVPIFSKVRQLSGKIVAVEFQYFSYFKATFSSIPSIFEKTKNVVCDFSKFWKRQFDRLM